MWCQWCNLSIFKGIFYIFRVKNSKKSSIQGQKSLKSVANYSNCSIYSVRKAFNSCGFERYLSQVAQALKQIDKVVLSNFAKLMPNFLEGNVDGEAMWSFIKMIFSHKSLLFPINLICYLCKMVAHHNGVKMSGIGSTQHWLSSGLEEGAPEMKTLHGHIALLTLTPWTFFHLGVYQEQGKMIRAKL